MQSTSFPTLSTERLVLRALEADDEQAIFLLRSDESVNRYLEDFRHHSIEQTREFIGKIRAGVPESQWVYWAISPKGAKDLIGTICLWNFSNDGTSAEVGYVLHPDFQGKGLMREALEQVIQYGFEVANLEIIEAYTHRDNQASTRLLENFHFKRAPGKTGGAEVHEIIFTLYKRIGNPE